MKLSQSQLNQLLNLGNISTGGAAPYFPDFDLGQNMPTDGSSAAMRIFNDRVKPIGFYFPGTGQVPLTTGNQDPITGFPTVPFAFKLADGSLAADPSTSGTWFVMYQATAKMGVTVSFGNHSVVSSHAFSGTTGSFQLSFTSGGSALMLNFDRGVTDLQCYDPTTSAAAIAGNIPGLWNAQFLRTTAPYRYLRFMDCSNANGDYTNSLGVWINPVNWSDRSTPTNYKTNVQDGRNRGLPVEWLVDILNLTSKSGWFNISELSSDDCITQYATYIAQNLTPGLWAGFELGNERWNTAPGFYSYRKSGVAGLMDAQAAQPVISVPATSLISFVSDGTTATVVFSANHAQLSGYTVPIFGLQAGYTGFAPTGLITVVDAKTISYPCTQPNTGGIVSPTTVLGATGSLATAQNIYSLHMMTLNVVSFASDGIAPGVAGATATATVVYNQPHGATTGTIPFIVTPLTGYTGFKPVTGATIKVIDAITISYPCTQPATAPVIASKVMAFTTPLILNFGSTLFAGHNSGAALNSVYDYTMYWHYRRVWQMAKLLRDAFTAAGRSTADCKPILAVHAGDGFRAGVQYISAYYTALQGSGTKISDRITALSVGGYLSLGQNGGTLNPGFAPQLSQGLLKTRLDPTLVTPLAVSLQLQEMADRVYGCNTYQAFISSARDQGCEVWGYEIGNDITTITTAGNDTPDQVTAKVAYQTDYVNFGAQQTAMYTEWIRGIAQAGFSKIGWYKCGAGGYASTGTFNLGLSANEIDYTTAPSGQSPKFRAILASKATSTIFITRHSFPCILDGRDCVGNEALVTVSGTYFALSGLNHPYYTLSYPGPLFNGLTYQVWSEIGQTVTVTILGDNKNAAALPVSVKRLGANESLFTAAASVTNKVIGIVQITLQPGSNYVFVSCPLGATSAASIFIRSIQFS